MNKNLKLLLASRMVSTLGDQLYIISLSVILYKITNSAVASSGILAIKGIVYIIGLLCFKNSTVTSQKKVSVIADVLRFLLIVMLILLVKINFIYSYFIALLLEIIQLHYSPARFVLINLASDKDSRNLSNTADQTINTIGLALGSVLGGVMLTEYGYEIALLVDAFSFLMSGMLIQLIDIDLKENKEDDKTRGTRGALVWLKTKNNFFTVYILLIIPCIFFAIGAFNSLLVIFVLNSLKLNATYYGYFESIMAVGLFVGSLAVIRINKKVQIEYICFSIIFIGLFYFLSVQSKIPSIIGIMLFLGAFFNAAFSCVYRTIVAGIFQNQNDLGMAWMIYRSLNIIFSSAGTLLFSFAADFSNIKVVESICGLLLMILGIVFLIILSKTKAEYSNFVSAQ